jgi:hypothetical protein
MAPDAISEHDVAETYRLLGRRPPSLRWAKAELFLGLGAVACKYWLLWTEAAAAALGAGPGDLAAATRPAFRT